MMLEFAKMHGLGNDFMVLDLITQEYEPDPVQIARWGDRHTGVGFDQLLIIAPPTDPDVDFRYRIFNTDGSEAEQCGNGARCVARLVAAQKLSPKREVRWQTSTGTITTRLLRDGQVAVDMGVPSIDPPSIPCEPAAAVDARAIEPSGPPADDAADSGCPSRPRFYTIGTTDGRLVEVLPVSMGNPHGVVFVDDTATTPVAEIGAALTAHPFFPEHANIGFCEIVDPGFVRLRVFERGAGETRACGTGACAAAVAGRLVGRLRERVKVSLPGGKVRIDWQGPGSAVTMTGPATLVYHGRIEIS